MIAQNPNLLSMALTFAAIFFSATIVIKSLAILFSQEKNDEKEVE
jgi:hypothetical protein